MLSLVTEGNKSLLSRTDRLITKSSKSLYSIQFIFSPRQCDRVIPFFQWFSILRLNKSWSDCSLRYNSILSNPTPDYLFERLSFISEIRANNATRKAKLYQFKRKSCTTLQITWPLMIHTCIHLYVLVSSFVMLAQVNFTWIISTIEDLL